jgi:hypothetical protein
MEGLYAAHNKYFKSQNKRGYMQLTINILNLKIKGGYYCPGGSNP